MKQRRIIATILTIILTVATVLTVFAAFRFEVQFPSKLNTFTYDQSSASFKLNGNNSFTLNLSDPGSAGNFSAVVVGDKDVPATEGNESTPATPGRAGTPLMYSYKLSLGEGYDIEQNKVLLSSIFVYLNGEIQGTLYSVMTDNLGMIGTTSYVLPNDSVTDNLRLELHLASDATPYIQNATTDGEGNVSNKNSSLTVTVNCTATNHNAQKYTFVNSTENLIQAISEVNRGAQNKTIVLYGGVEVTTEVPAVTNPCTFDVQSATFTAPITVNITGGVTEGEPTDIVTVLSTKGAYEGDATGFAITAGAIDRKDNAANVKITVNEGANPNHYSIQHIIDSHLESLIAHGMQIGDELDFSAKGFGCYIDEITVSGSSYLNYNSTAKKLTVTDDPQNPLLISEVVTATIKMITGDTHTHTVKVIGASDAVFANLFEEGGELYYLSQLTNPGIMVHYSIPLPTVIKSKNATIEWHSSDPEMFTDRGECSPSAHGNVTLTAVIRINEKVFTKHLTIYVATQTNQDKLAMMIGEFYSKIAPSLNYVYSTTDGHKNGMKDLVFLPQTTKVTGTNSYKQTAQMYAVVDGAEELTTIELSDFDIKSLTYTFDKDVYDCLGWQDDSTKNCVKLDYSTFQEKVVVTVTAEFYTGKPETVTDTIEIDVQLGKNADLGNQALAYVQQKLNDVNVLQNMLNTRGAADANDELGEEGHFYLPSDYNGLKILYEITDGRGIATLEEVEGEKTTKFVIHPDRFQTFAYSVPVQVTILIRGAETVTDANTIKSETLYFEVPPAITIDQYGFANKALFLDVREQVNANLVTYDEDGVITSDERWIAADATNEYILLRDIAKCTILSIDGSNNGTSSINGLAYFTNLTTFGASNFNSSFAASLSRAAATFTGLSELTLSNVGLTDISPLTNLDLTYLDVSYNSGLVDIAGVADFDATDLAYLNVSGTGVEINRFRSMLTAMYYKYETKHNETPRYFYTHKYTPIADGALLLEPDAISVTTENGKTTATISGSELTLNTGTVNGETIRLTQAATLTIDGNKSVSIPSGTTITIIKKEGTVSSTEPITIKDAIISYELSAGIQSTSFKVGNLWLNGPITISNATIKKVDTDSEYFSNIVVITSGKTGTITSANAEDDLSGTRVVTLAGGTEVPVLGGVLQQNGNDVVITSLSSFGNANDDWEEGTDGSTTIGSNNATTEIVVSGASLNGTDITVGPNGGTITVKSTSTYTFAVLSNTVIQANTPGNMIRVNSDGTISVIKLDTSNVTSAEKVFFTKAEIKNDLSDDSSYTEPTIHIEAGCVMTVDNTISVLIPAATTIPLPQYAIGTNANGTVTLESFNKNESKPGNTYSGKKFDLINFSINLENTEYTNDVVFDFLNGGTYTYNGWVLSYGQVLIWKWFSVTQTAKAINGAPTYLWLNKNTWIPITNDSISFDGGNNISDLNSNTWGKIDYNSTYKIASFDLGNSGQYTDGGSINISGAFPNNNRATFTIRITNKLPTSSNPQVTLPTDTVNPDQVGIRTLMPDKSQSIAPNVVDYYGTSIRLFGCSLSGNTITANSGYQWYAIMIDGEYITISDGATVTISDYQQQNENGTITPATTARQVHIRVTDGTSTIGKGALLAKENISVDYNTLPDGNSTSIKYDNMESIANGQISEDKVTVTYSKSNDNFILAVVDDLLFEPIITDDNEKTGVSILYLLSEVPGVLHNTYNKGQPNEHGTYIQLASTVHYGNDGLVVSVKWQVAPGSESYVKMSDYYGSPRLETKQPTGLTFVNGSAAQEVSIIAEVNVMGVITYRTFTFTVTYNQS